MIYDRAASVSRSGSFLRGVLATVINTVNNRFGVTSRAPLPSRTLPTISLRGATHRWRSLHARPSTFTDELWDARRPTGLAAASFCPLVGHQRAAVASRSACRSPGGAGSTRMLAAAGRIARVGVVSR